MVRAPHVALPLPQGTQASPAHHHRPLNQSRHIDIIEAFKAGPPGSDLPCWTLCWTDYLSYQSQCSTSQDAQPQSSAFHPAENTHTSLRACLDHLFMRWIQSHAHQTRIIRSHPARLRQLTPHGIVPYPAAGKRRVGERQAVTS